MVDFGDVITPINWRRATASSAVIAWGLVRVTGLDGDNLTVAAPNADSQSQLWVTSPTGIQTGSVGAITFDSPAAIAYEESDGTPAVGDVWGSISGGHLLRKDRAGWRCISAGVDGVAEWVREDRLRCKGKLDGSLSYQGSATLSVWKYNGSAEADSGENITVYDWLLSSGQSVASGKQVTAFYDLASSRWYLDAAQCS